NVRLQCCALHASTAQTFHSQLAAVAKQAYGQRHGMPTAMVMQEVNKFGLGLTSLLVDYNTICTKHMVEAMNDGAAYGTISHALLRLQAKQTAMLTASKLGSVARCMLRMRQLSAAQQGGLCIHRASTGTLVNLGGTDLTRLVDGLLEDRDGSGATCTHPGQ
ncbi:Uncharacterized protein APZ42_004467, partial [Daphnia magna]